MAATIQSVGRALDILEAVARAAGPSGVRELARELGLKVQTLHNLMLTLAERGYLSKDEASGRYGLGPACFDLAARTLQGVDLPRLAGGPMQRLAAELGESVVLGMMVGGELTWAASARGTATIIANMDHPAARDGYDAATGLALLAYASAEDLGAYVKAHPISQSTSQDIHTEADLAAELGRVREQGVAILTRQGPDVLSAVGAPIFDATGAVQGALGISMPAPRFRGAHRQAVVDGLQAAASHLSSLLGRPADGKRGRESFLEGMS